MCYADRQEAPRLRTICRVVVYARRNPTRMNRHIISEFGRMAPRCSLIYGNAHGLAQTGDALRVRTFSAARNLRKERREPERGVEAHILAR